MKVLIAPLVGVSVVAALCWLTLASVGRSRSVAIAAQQPGIQARVATAQSMQRLAAEILKIDTQRRAVLDRAYRNSPQAIELERLRQEDLKALAIPR